MSWMYESFTLGRFITSIGLNAQVVIDTCKGSTCLGWWFSFSNYVHYVNNSLRYSHYSRLSGNDVNVHPVQMVQNLAPDEVFTNQVQRLLTSISFKDFISYHHTWQWSKSRSCPCHTLSSNGWFYFGIRTSLLWCNNWKPLNTPVPWQQLTGNSRLFWQWKRLRSSTST